MSSPFDGSSMKVGGGGGGGAAKKGGGGGGGARARKKGWDGAKCQCFTSCVRKCIYVG